MDYIYTQLHLRHVIGHVYNGSPMSHSSSIRQLLSLLGLCAAFATPAAADIYVNGYDDAEEIRISNMPATEGDQVLISEPSPQPENASAEPVLATNTITGSLPFAAAVSAAAKQAALDPALLHAVITAESGHNPRAVSPCGAQGLMQLMPATSRRFGLSDPYDPVQNLRAGASYLRELKAMFKGDLSLMLAAYNAGPGAVLRFGSRIPPFEETRRYVPKVLGIYRALSSRQM